MSQYAYRVLTCRKDQRRAICWSEWFFGKDEAERHQEECRIKDHEHDYHLEESLVGNYFVRWSDQRTRAVTEELVALPIKDFSGALRAHLARVLGHSEFKIYRSFLQNV